MTMTDDEPSPGSRRRRSQTLSPWWMRPTAEGLEEENRSKPKTETPPAERPIEPAAATPQPDPEPQPERPAFSEGPREWRHNLPPEPVFAEVEEPAVSAETPNTPETVAMMPSVAYALPAAEPLDEEVSEEELEAAEADAEAEAGETEEKEGDEKDAEGRRRRRSRGRRGGRRRSNGKPAAGAAAEPAEEADEEEPWREQPAAFEEP